MAAIPMNGIGIIIVTVSIIFPTSNSPQFSTSCPTSQEMVYLSQASLLVVL